MTSDTTTDTTTDDIITDPVTGIRYSENEDGTRYYPDAFDPWVEDVQHLPRTPEGEGYTSGWVPVYLSERVPRTPESEGYTSGGVPVYLPERGVVIWLPEPAQ